MNRFSLFLADIDIKDTLMPDFQKTSVSRGNLTLLFSAFGVVTLLILFWALFIRKRPDESSRRYRYPSREPKANQGSESGGESGRRRRRKRRRPRNPTLAETGGLPPVRTEGYFEDPP